MTRARHPSLQSPGQFLPRLNELGPHFGQLLAKGVVDMTPDHDLPEDALATDSPASCNDVLSDLRQVRGELATVLAFTLDVPHWRLPCPMLATDQDTLLRLDGHEQDLKTGRDSLVRAEALYSLQARSDTPSPQISEAKLCIPALTRLLQLATLHRLPEFLQRYKNAPRPIRAKARKDVRACIDRLSTAGDLSALAFARRSRTDTSGIRPSGEAYRSFVAPYKQALVAVETYLRAALAKYEDECVRTESERDNNINCAIEQRVLSRSAVLVESVKAAQAAIAIARSVISRDAESVDQVRQVWKAVYDRKEWVHRRRRSFVEEDVHLVSEWANGKLPGSDWHRAMESARHAELVALEIYHELDGPADDLSILQVTRRSDPTWRTADIATPTRRWIDVKNARRSDRSPNSYSKYLVPKFKHRPGREDVVVSAFLSANCSGEVTDDTPEAAVCWVGETTLDSIRRLNAAFTKEHLQVALFTKSASSLPPWVFDYPDAFYRERDVALQAIRSNAYVLPRRECPVSLLVLANRVQSAPPDDPLAVEAASFGQRLGTVRSVTRPVVFLHILDRFCSAVRDSKPFPTGALREILFPKQSATIGALANAQTPLAMLDPLETISELLKALDAVSRLCSIQKYKFVRFNLTGKGILRGCLGDSPERTILAFCGGCGRSPLYIGQNEWCCRCWWLVCDACDHCTLGCPRIRQRRLKNMRP